MIPKPYSATDRVQRQMDSAIDGIMKAKTATTCLKKKEAQNQIKQALKFLHAVDKTIGPAIQESLDR